MANENKADQPADVAIIGASFAGLSAAIILARARRRVVVIDDGLTRNRFAKASHGFLGQDGVSPGVIRGIGLAEVLAYPTVRHIAARVQRVEQTDGGFLVDGLRVQRVILASGQRDILPEIPGLAECWGLTANQCPYCHGYELADLPTGILLGPRPQAGLYLRQIRRWAGTLTVFDNGEVLAAETLALIAELGLAHVSGRIAALEHEAGRLRSVWVAGAVAVPLQAFYLGSRTEPAAPFAAALGCEMLEGHAGPYVKTDNWQRTTVPGVFAAGDLATMMPTAIFAAASGASAGFGCDMDLAGLLPE